MKVQIIYASLTGNTEHIAYTINDVFENLGFEVAIDECTQVEAEAFLEADICIVGTYTYGDDGADFIPYEMESLYDDLLEIDLTGKIFGVFGSGDTFYEEYCQAVDDFEKVLVNIGGIKGAESVKVDLSPDDSDMENIHQFVEHLVSSSKHQKS